jgi:hypothetical protein
MRSPTSLIASLARSKHDPAQILVALALRRALEGCESVLDIGCGVSMTMRNIGVTACVGFEGYGPSVERARELRTHDQIVQGNVRELQRFFKPKQFDACVAIDVIEHLDKEGGLQLMRDMERIARKRVVFFTPSGFLPQGHTVAGDYQTHVSGWEAKEMAGYGYEAVGLLGPKSMRGEYHALKRRPRWLWGLLSLMSHFCWTRSHPEKAAAMLCWKTVGSASPE